MATTTHSTVRLYLYVHREHREFLKQAVHSVTFSARFPKPTEGQTLVSAHITTINDVIPRIVDYLYQNRVPYDLHRLDTGGQEFGRFDLDHQYRLSANLKDKTSVSRDWNNQVQLRKEWATLKLINLISE